MRKRTGLNDRRPTKTRTRRRKKTTVTRPEVQRRIDQLVADGMDADQAGQQANAEYVKGVLGTGCCVVVGGKRRTRKGAE